MLDKWCGWKVGLPGETTSYTTETLRIPIQDHRGAITLGATLHRPVLAGLLGTVLLLSPYGRTLTHWLLALRGYVVLIVSSRGTADSEGE